METISTGLKAGQKGPAEEEKEKKTKHTEDTREKRTTARAQSQEKGKVLQEHQPTSALSPWREGERKRGKVKVPRN